MYTTHGHQIPGSPIEGDPPKTRARCGGPSLCRQCGLEAAGWHAKHGNANPMVPSTMSREDIVALREKLEQGGTPTDEEVVQVNDLLQVILQAFQPMFKLMMEMDPKILAEVARIYTQPIRTEPN